MRKKYIQEKTSISHAIYDAAFTVITFGEGKSYDNNTFTAEEREDFNFMNSSYHRHHASVYVFYLSEYFWKCSLHRSITTN